MTGITLSFEEIRRAPPEVRRWIEHELGTGLGVQVHSSESSVPPAQLAECSRDELAALLNLIQGAFPVVNVFFELGRKGNSFARDRLEAYRLADIQHHTRLQSPQQVLSCLNLIDESLHQIRGSTEVSFYGLDGEYCFITTQTQQNIRRLWFEVIGGKEIASALTDAQSPDGPVFSSPVSSSQAQSGSTSPSGMQPPQG